MRTRTTAALFGAAVLALTGVACSEEGNVFSLEVGDCFNEPESTTQISDVEIVDCDEPHFAEIYAEQELDGEDFPGDVTISEETAEVCTGDAFTDFVGAPIAEQDLVLPFPLTPTEQSWDAGDRLISCALVSTDPGGDLEGSAEGIAEGTASGGDDTGSTDPGTDEGGEDETGDDPVIGGGEDETGDDPVIGGGSDEEAGDPAPVPDLDDAEEAQLAQECFDGSGSSCDTLFGITPIDSEGEAYGETCGGRFETANLPCSVAIGD